MFKFTDVTASHVLFFDGLILTRAYWENLAGLPEWQPWGTILICINPRWPP